MTSPSFSTDFNIYQVLELSTAHMPDQHALNDPMLIVDNVPFGHLVLVIDDDDDINALPNWIRPIMRAACEKNCRYVRFDADARTYPCFVSYDW